MLIGPLQFSAHCFSPGVLFPPLVHLNSLLLHHHIANERLLDCWHLKWRQAMASSLIAAICSDRLFCLFVFLLLSVLLFLMLSRDDFAQFATAVSLTSPCATISSSLWHRSQLWADEAAKRCRAFGDKEFNKVICVLFTSVEGQKVESTYLILKVFHQMLFFMSTIEHKHTHARMHAHRV